jgi:hypothetical protein
VTYKNINQPGINWGSNAIHLSQYDKPIGPINPVGWTVNLSARTGFSVYRIDDPGGGKVNMSGEEKVLSRRKSVPVCWMFIPASRESNSASAYVSSGGCMSHKQSKKDYSREACNQ